MSAHEDAMRVVAHDFAPHDPWELEQIVKAYLGDLLPSIVVDGKVVPLLGNEGTGIGPYSKIVLQALTAELRDGTDEAMCLEFLSDLLNAAKQAAREVAE